MIRILLRQALDETYLDTHLNIQCYINYCSRINV